MTDEYKYTPHNFNGKLLNTSYCLYCGLVYSNNKFTEWAIKQGCNWKDHSSFESKRKQYTELF